MRQSPLKTYRSVNYSNFDPTIYGNIILIKGSIDEHNISLKCFTPYPPCIAPEGRDLWLLKIHAALCKLPLKG